MHVWVSGGGRGFAGLACGGGRGVDVGLVLGLFKAGGWMDGWMEGMGFAVCCWVAVFVVERKVGNGGVGAAVRRARR